MSNNQSVSDANSQNDDLFDMLEPTPIEYSNIMDYKVQKIQESTYKPQLLKVSSFETIHESRDETFKTTFKGEKQEHTGININLRLPKL